MVMVIVVVVVVLECNFLVLKLNYYRLVYNYLLIRHPCLPLFVGVMLRPGLSFWFFDRLLLRDALRSIDMQGRVVRRRLDRRALGECEHRGLDGIAAERDLWIDTRALGALYFAEGFAEKSLICYRCQGIRRPLDSYEEMTV